MANPRKFSEKIALHNQKQAEETAQFEKIMREVSDVTAKVLPTTPDRGSGKHTLRINQSLGSFRGGSLPNVSAGGPKSTTHNKNSIKPEPQDTNQILLLSNLDDVSTHHYRESRNRSVGGPMRSKPIERRIDTSPYSGPYLSPPPDTSWRRTNSDSALHHSAMQGLGGDRNENSGSRWGLHQTMNNQEHIDRPKSSCDVPRVPGINIYPSIQEPGTIQIPIGSNTGSLPDLTSVHFPSPLHTPIDQDADHSSSPYSSSPVSASPATLSPTSVPTGMRTAQGQQFQFTPRSISQHQGVTLENNGTSIVDGYAHTPLTLAGLGNLYQTHCPTSSPSPTQHHQQQQQVHGPGYRTPLARPSPQSSPGLGGRHSAPSSPAAPSPIPDYFLSHTQASLLQQHFEQFSMIDPPSYMETPTSGQLAQSHQQTLTDVSSIVGGSELGEIAYYPPSPSPHVYPTAPSSLHTTPNTPTSIPDIILTDFSNTTDDLNRHDFGDDSNRQEFTSKDLSNVISGALEADIFSADESLRAGLGHLDFDELQMLSNPDMNVISDSAEDHFRLDRL